MDLERQQAALAYLRQHHVLTLATCSGAEPWAAALFYVNDGFDLIFLSAGHTRHARHLSRHPFVAATIQEDYDTWQSVKGIQLEGVVRLLGGPERQKAVGLYRRKYPFLATAPEGVQQALVQVNWYRLTPARLYLVDNSLGFGHRDEIPLPPVQASGTGHEPA